MARGRLCHPHLITTAAGLWQRALLVIGGLLLIKPGLKSDLVGVVLAAMVIATQVMAKRAVPKPEIKPEIAAE